MTKQEMLIAGGLYVVIGALTPVLAVLATTVDEITPHLLAVMIIAALISGAGACKAFTSTTFADNQVEGGKALKPSIKKKA